MFFPLFLPSDSSYCSYVISFISFSILVFSVIKKFLSPVAKFVPSQFLFFSLNKRTTLSTNCSRNIVREQHFQQIVHVTLSENNNKHFVSTCNWLHWKFSSELRVFFYVTLFSKYLQMKWIFIDPKKTLVFPLFTMASFCCIQNNIYQFLFSLNLWNRVKRKK